MTDHARRDPELFARAVERACGEQPTITGRYLAVLYLWLVEQLTYEEIGGRLGFSAKTASMHRLRARDLLGYDDLGEMERDLLVCYGIELEREQ